MGYRTKVTGKWKKNTKNFLFAIVIHNPKILSIYTYLIFNIIQTCTEFWIQTYILRSRRRPICPFLVVALGAIPTGIDNMGLLQDWGTGQSDCYQGNNSFSFKLSNQLMEKVVKRNSEIT
jgi:hypothetical protein